MKNETVLFDSITPHENPVNISELLTNIEAVIKKHVILNDHAAAALAVWVLHTYTFEFRDTVAYVAIESPEKRCGKTTLLSVLAAMAHRPLISSNITVGALFRAIHDYSPTLFIDEADTFLAGNSIMRGIINSGNTRRTAYVLRLSAAKKDQVGRASPRAVSEPTTEPRALASGSGIKKYSCWCPKVIAMIGEVPDTIADRSIVVKMARKLTTETCAPLAELESDLLNRSGRPTFQTSDDNSPSPGGEGRGEGELSLAEARGSNIPSVHGEGARQGTIIGEIRSKCARFALDASPFIALHPKICGQGLNDRAADTFDPLYVIARHAGPEWERKLNAAALALSFTADTEFSGAGLILDILDIIVLSGEEKIFTRDLVARLRDGGMKSQALKYSDINEHKIAKILRSYGVKPVTMRIGAEVKNGYVGGDFREALKRYVPREDAIARVEGIRRQAKLHVEANAEARKLADEQAALLNQVIARAPKGRVMSVSETMSIIQELRNKRVAEPDENLSKSSVNDNVDI